MLTSTGNIDTTKLEKELAASLAADIKYKQTDNMKKKAVKVAGSYDQFKAMVACAHLKTLKSKEIDSLKDVRKGWMKEKPANRDNSALILDQEFNESVKIQTSAHLSNPFTGEDFKKPKTPLELERDWRRVTTIEDKMKYLDAVGRKRITSLMEKDGNGELLEQVLTAIMDGVSRHAIEQASASSSSASSSTVEIIEGIQTADDNVSVPDHQSQAVPAPETVTSELLVEDSVQDLTTGEAPTEKDTKPAVADSTTRWLVSIAGMNKFSLAICFVSSDLRARIASYLREHSLRPEVANQYHGA